MVNNLTNCERENYVQLEGKIIDAASFNKRLGYYDAILNVREAIVSTSRDSRYYNVSLVFTKEFYSENSKLLLNSQDKYFNIEGKLFSIKIKKSDGSIGYSKCVLVTSIKESNAFKNVNIVKAIGVVKSIRIEDLDNPYKRKVNFTLVIGDKIRFNIYAWDDVANDVLNLKDNSVVSIIGEVRTYSPSNIPFWKHIIFQHINCMKIREVF